MKKLIFILPLWAFSALGSTAFSEFYAQTSGSNLNAGSTTNDAAVLTFAGGTFVAATGVYTIASGNTLGVHPLDWASVYTTSGATISQFIGQILSTNQTTITLSLVAFAGNPATPSASANATTLKIGGAWAGPNAAVGFPFGFLAQTATNGASVWPRCSFRNNATYNVTASIAHSLGGPVVFQGMTSVPGDLGKATIDGGATGTSYVVLNMTGADLDFVDLITGNNGNSGSASLVNCGGAGQNWIRCVAHDSWRGGFAAAASGLTFVECEAYNCNKNNQSGGYGGFYSSGARHLYLRCISHDNTTANGVGFYVQDGAVLEDCIADSNGSDGSQFSANGFVRYLNCEFYNNTGNGIALINASLSSVYIENCNFIKNGAFGITSSGSSLRNGAIVNCGFGSGTMVNTSGTIAANVGAMNETGTITYAANALPWVDAPNGDFRINLTAAKSAGRGSFTETASSYAGTIGYPDIGAAQGSDTNSAAAGGSFTFAQ